MEWKKIYLPLTDEIIDTLRCGDLCLLTGKVITARDRAHKRIMEMTERGENLPFELSGEVLYYVGPTPAKPGRIIGSAGPTTSSRMDPFTSLVLKLGIRGMIGKGRRDEETKRLLVKHRAVYFSSFGGAGAFLSEKIKSSKVVAFEDLASEAVHELYVEDFPVVVAVDTNGDDIYEHAVHHGK